MLANFEILNLLKEEEKDSSNQDLNTLDFELLKYLKSFKSLKSTSFLQELKVFKLNQLEMLHLINHLPKSLVELTVLIEEYQDRFSEKDTEFILATLQKYSV